MAPINFVLILVGLVLCGMLCAYLFRATTAAVGAPRNSRLVSVLLLLLIVSGGIVRFANLDFGVPNFFHPDEERKVFVIYRLIHSGDPSPKYFRHPSFMLYSSALNTLLIQKLTGQGEIDFSQILVGGRSVSALLGTLSIGVLFLTVRLFASDKTALLSAALLAFSPLHVVCSRYIKEDVAMIFFLLLALYFSLLVLRKGKPRYLILAGLLAGFATSTKYTGVLTVGFLFIPFTVRVLEQTGLWRKLITDQSTETFGSSQFKKGESYDLAFYTVFGLLLSVLGFLMVSPYVLIDTPTFLADFLWEKRHMEKGHGSIITAASQLWMYHFKNSLWGALNPAVMFFASIALGFLAWRRRFFDLLILAMVLYFYLPAEWVKAKPAPQPERYILPCVPFLAVAFSIFAFSVWQAVREYKLLRIAVTALIAVCCSAQLYQTVEQAMAIGNDTRTVASEWIALNIPPGSKILIDHRNYSPPISKEKYKVTTLVSNGKLFQRFTAGALANRTGASHLVVSSLYYKRFIGEASMRNSIITRQLKEFFSKNKPLIEFSNRGFDYGFHNPTIRIYELPKPMPSTP